MNDSMSDSVSHPITHSVIHISKASYWLPPSSRPMRASKKITSLFCIWV